MLNYVWLALIIIAILVAAGTDLHNKFTDKYREDVTIPVQLELSEPATATSGKPQMAILKMAVTEFNQYYAQNLTGDTLRCPVQLQFQDSARARMTLNTSDEEVPKIWKSVARAQGHPAEMRAHMILIPGTTQASFRIEKTRFEKLAAVTDAAFNFAKVAVMDIALPLIGIMAMWLGVMKIAEQAGMIRILAAAIAPITRRLFPEVPTDHPAMGAMVLNIAANWLGLSNAATPFGLKAMEELQKLNPKKDTATNAMVMFLGINTACITLIPATIIGLRVAMGSAKPAEIIGTTIVASTCATITAIIAVKLLGRLPAFRKDDPYRIREQNADVTSREGEKNG
ncbi:MAG: nucleoside recognition protein [candidate division KSB1 bacterium]|nr:nucleoside recognition protein [candidate division KSB1 bacterium]MDZ7303403.1 nucleoside recognition protein [candidate division KSB1 bacterium]MDZ7312279.1 nucleoside recognition protein [candidate division KSB1 bacterium]